MKEKRKESIIMPAKKKHPVRLEELTPLDRVMQDGWKSLTSKETGKIGGLITKKKRQTGNNKKNDKNITNVN